MDTVVDSRQGLELARAHHYDLLICDLRMPHLDGRGFYGELAREENPLQHRLSSSPGILWLRKRWIFCGLAGCLTWPSHFWWTN